MRAIFPEGVPAREYILRLNTCRTIFAALYVGAVEGAGRWLAPRLVYRMRDDIANDADPASRSRYYEKVPPSREGGWYADNSREGSRDEGVRRGLIPLNAMVVLPGVPPTSSLGRYALSRDFAALLSPSLAVDEFEKTAREWRVRYLSPAALARASLLQDRDAASIEVVHPGGGTTILPAGESHWMTKRVVEDFAARFLVTPRVVWISDSKNKLFSDNTLARILKIDIDAAKVLPDVILVDLDPPGRKGELLMVFVEVVSTDGPVDELRRGQLIDLLRSSPRGYRDEDAAFVTVYADRGSRAASKAMRELAWNTFAWFVSEPEHIVHFQTGHPSLLVTTN